MPPPEHLGHVGAVGRHEAVDHRAHLLAAQPVPLRALRRLAPGVGVRWVGVQHGHAVQVGVQLRVLGHARVEEVVVDPERNEADAPAFDDHDVGRAQRARLRGTIAKPVAQRLVERRHVDGRRAVPERLERAQQQVDVVRAGVAAALKPRVGWSVRARHRLELARRLVEVVDRECHAVVAHPARELAARRRLAAALDALQPDDGRRPVGAAPRLDPRVQPRHDLVAVRHLDLTAPERARPTRRPRRARAARRRRAAAAARRRRTPTSAPRRSRPTRA